MSRDLLFEIGVEEIPSAPLYEATVQLRTLAEKAFAEARLGYAELETFGGPRRLVLRVSGLAESQEDRIVRSKGPAAKAAFDAQGNATKAAEGFARGKGVAVSDLVRETDDSGNEYMFAIVEQLGNPAVAVLPELLAGLASALAWPKSQRWGSGTARFIRPVRWLLALFGEEIVPVQFAGLTADRYTQGHRFLAPQRTIPVASADSYDAAARAGMFVYDAAERARLIREGIEALEQQHGVTAVVPEKTFAEVVNLVEWPTVVMGHFDESFLEVPREVIETAMTKHQRYFPVQSADGRLSNGFIVAHNGDPARSEAIVAGHERVIRARLADANYFYSEDLAQNMEDWVASLDSITFHEKLGTSGDKVRRIETLVARLAALGEADAGVTAEASRAAHLAKADLVSHAVVEFPALQGVMGCYYALAQGETEQVATAIIEHYRPRFAGDELPSTTAGMLVSAADKLDTMVGIFAIGQGPTGSADPYALRRGAIGILSMILDGKLGLDDMAEAIAAALETYSDAVLTADRNTIGAQVASFLRTRLAVMLKDRGLAYDTVEALLALSTDRFAPADIAARGVALQGARDNDPVLFADLSSAFTRAKNLADFSLGTESDPALMGGAEAALADALSAAEQAAAASFEVAEYSSVVGVLASLRGPIDAFFDGVMVMDKDDQLRANRLKLLNRFVALFVRFADLSKISE